MAKLAAELPKSKFGNAPHKGPSGSACVAYADCDTEDLEAVRAMKDSGLTWKQIQEQVDRIMEIEEEIPEKLFIYHWRPSCSCWKRKYE